MKNNGLAKLFTGYFILSLVSHPVLTLASEVASDGAEKVETVETSSAVESSSEQEVPTEESSQTTEIPASSELETSSELVEIPFVESQTTESSAAPAKKKKKKQSSGVSSATYEDGITIDEAHFPDPIFRSWVISWLDNGYKEDDPIDFDAKINPIARIDLANIKSLKGIEYFGEDIKELSLKISGFKDLDVSTLPNLEKLTVDKETDLTTVVFGEQPLLKNVVIMNSNLTKIDVSSLKGLKVLNLKDSSVLSDVQLGELAELEELGLTGTVIKTLDASKSPKLKQLELEGVASLETLDLESNTQIERLVLSGTSLKALNVANATSLTYLDVSSTEIKDLNVEATTKLTHLNVSKTALTELNVETAISLIELSVSDTALTELDVTKTTNLTKLVANNTKITELNLIKNSSLAEVQAENAKLTTVDVSGLASLKTLKLAGNPKLATVQFGANKVLETIDLSKSIVAKINLKDDTTPNLKELIYKDGGAGSLVINGLKRLTLISMNGSKELTSVVIDGAPLLKDLLLETANGLTGVTLDDVPKLETLKITNHQMKKIDLASAPELKVLNLRGGLLETLDLSSNDKLTDVNLNENKLSHLNTEKNLSLASFQADKQTPGMVVEWKNNAWEISFDGKIDKEDFKNIVLNTDNLSNRLVWDHENGIARFNGFGDGAPTALVYTYQTNNPKDAVVSVNAKLTPKEQFGKIVVNYFDQTGKKITTVESDEYIGKVGTTLNLNTNPQNEPKKIEGYTYVKYEYIEPVVLSLRSLSYRAAVAPSALPYKQGVGTVNLTYQATNAPVPIEEEDDDNGTVGNSKGTNTGSGLSTKGTNSGSSKLGSSGSSSLPKTGELVAESMMWLGTGILGMMVLMMHKKRINDQL
ncbi:MucBP domain-containing protein [uncultured Vagococcus sp.]|uniref:MucBP domain-containing protein n=1 Tax=uncultured Vagococcus sp. TaxID=189676 RepID=UPI0028D1891D|nr:MucBP domain-containing protein [uncultured Vagococcus sp.]